MKPLARVTAATVDVLSSLIEGRDSIWGLQIIRATGRPPGSVYPILERLERSGWVASEWEADSERSGPRRRFYRLTADGAAAARQAVNDFRPRSAVGAATVARPVVPAVVRMHASEVTE